MQKIVKDYQTRIGELQSSLDDLSKRSKQYAFVRLLVILLGFAVLFGLSSFGALAIIVGLVVIFAVFAFVLKRHDKIDRQRQHTALKIQLNENEINALMRFVNDYYDGLSFDMPGHYYSNDLDVFGPHSLFGIINRSATYHGNRQLASWFSSSGNKAEIENRTTAIKELETKLEWRQAFFTDLYELRTSHTTNFAMKVRTELDADLQFMEATWLRIYRKLLPLVWILLIVLTYFDWSSGSKLMVAFLLINLGVTMKFVSPISQIQHQLSKSSNLLERFMKALHHIMNTTWTAPLTKSKVEEFELYQNDKNPIVILYQLKSIIDKLDYRLNIVATFILNGVALWDLMMMDRLMKWKANHLDRIEDIFGLMGYFEGIASLSNWAYNHPDYTYADLKDEHFSFSAKGIRHPLIPSGQNVANDFAIEPSDRINIVTGSNMAGKSTFLRTIGTNMILAYTGTKVAAHEMSSSVVQLMSYMRIKDALEENVSTFKAELNRVELMLSLVKDQTKCLILIDEMLRGTNSKDKLKGSINITKALIADRAYAMIATHDIKLAELVEAYPDVIQNYYFDINFENGDLKFDYKIKKGICENFNASYLLKQIGIG